MTILQKWQTTSLSSCKLQAQQQSTLFFFILFCKLIVSSSQRELRLLSSQLGLVHRNLSPLASEPLTPPSARSAAHIPRLQIHKVQSLCKQRPCIFTITRCTARLYICHLHSVQNWQDQPDCVAPTDPLVCLSVKCPLIAMIGHASSSNNTRTRPFWPSVTLLPNFFRSISILGFLTAYRIFILGWRTWWDYYWVQNHNGGLIAVMCP